MTAATTTAIATLLAELEPARQILARCRSFGSSYWEHRKAGEKMAREIVRRIAPKFVPHVLQDVEAWVSAVPDLAIRIRRSVRYLLTHREAYRVALAERRRYGASWYTLVTGSIAAAQQLEIDDYRSYRKFLPVLIARAMLRQITAGI